MEDGKLTGCLDERPGERVLAHWRSSDIRRGVALHAALLDPTRVLGVKDTSPS